MGKPTMESDGFPKVCIVCEKPFRTQQNIQKCCSDRCARDWATIRSNRNAKAKRAEQKKRRT